MTPLSKNGGYPKQLDTGSSSANAKSTDGTIITQFVPKMPSGFSKTASLGNFTTGIKKDRYETQNTHRTKGSDSTRISVSGSRTGIPMHPKMSK
jgi:hypothetical protein